MQRLVITGPRQAVFEEVEMPTCGADEIVVQASVTAVSTGTELRVFRGIPVDEAGKFLHERVPFVLPTENGYSMAGRVTEVGPQVEGIAVGERVFVPAPHKQFAAMPAVRAVKLPDAVADEQAVFMNILEVAHIALRRGEPGPGENVAILGQGVIGLAALAYCRAFGFRTAVIDRYEPRLAIARRMGADLAISAEDEKLADRVKELFDGQGADLVLEAASVWPAVRSGMEIARPDGKLVVLSRHTDKPDFDPVGHPYLGKRLTLLTSYGHPPDGSRWDRRRSQALSIDLLARRRLDITPIVTHDVPWQRLPEVYEQLDGGDPAVVGVLVRWE